MNQPNYKSAKIILCLLFAVFMFGVPFLFLHTPLKDRIIAGKHLYIIGIFEVILTFFLCVSLYQIKSMQFPDRISYDVKRVFSKPIAVFVIVPFFATVAFLSLYPYNKSMAGIAVIVIVLVSQIYFKFTKKRK